MTIFCILFFVSLEQGGDEAVKAAKEEEEAGGEAPAMKSSELFLFLTIMITNGLFLVLWLFKFMMAMKNVIREWSDTRWYVWIYLCCRGDKLDTDAIKLRREAKREDIIEKIEDVLFYIKKMNQIYAKEIFYEGHDNFIKLFRNFLFWSE